MVDAHYNKPAGYVAYIVAFVISYVAIGAFDFSFTVAVLDDPISMHGSERVFSATFDVAAIVGFASLRLYGFRTWIGDAVLGILTVAAVGGLHVAAYVGAWAPLALAVGFVGGLLLFTLMRRRPAACAFAATELALATLQLIFIMFNI